MTNTLQTCSAIPTPRKTEIARILTHCSTLTEDLYMVFYLQPVTEVPFRRYTATNPTKQLELIVITKKRSSADQLLYNWIIFEAKQPLSQEFDRNLLILSEQEFIEAFNSLDAFRERVLSGALVYDRDGEFLFCS